MEILIIICVILLIVKKIWDDKAYEKRMQDLKQKNEFQDVKPYQEDNKSEYSNEDTIEKEVFSDKYEAIHLLTSNERNAFFKLKAIADKNNFIICPKVRLADIIKPHNGRNYMKYFGKIQSKHVDFVICDQYMNIQCIVELDDNSHNTTERRERDQFVDEILESVGYTVIRTRYINEHILDPIINVQIKF